MLPWFKADATHIIFFQFNYIPSLFIQGIRMPYLLLSSSSKSSNMKIIIVDILKSFLFVEDDSKQIAYIHLFNFPCNSL